MQPTGYSDFYVSGTTYAQSVTSGGSASPAAIGSDAGILYQASATSTAVKLYQYGGNYPIRALNIFQNSLYFVKAYTTTGIGDYYYNVSCN